MAVKAVTLMITEMEQKALNELLTFLKGTWQNARIVMFGSKVKGVQDEESDLDILIALPCDTG
jgi:predicted nucleotidyltransferase